MRSLCTLVARGPDTTIFGLHESAEGRQCSSAEGCFPGCYMLSNGRDTAPFKDSNRKATGPAGEYLQTRHVPSNWDGLSSAPDLRDSSSALFLKHVGTPITGEKQPSSLCSDDLPTSPWQDTHRQENCSRNQGFANYPPDGAGGRHGNRPVDGFKVTRAVFRYSPPRWILSLKGKSRSDPPTQTL